MSMSDLYRPRQSSLGGAVGSRASAVLGPLGLWKPKQRVRYHNEMPGEVQNKNQAANNSDYFYKTVDIKPISSLSIPTIVATPSYNQSTQSKRLARTPCDQCGYHNVPIMAHPISPLVRSQTNLELVSTGNARQALLPAIEFTSHGGGAEKNDKLEKHSNGIPPTNSNSTSIQTLQISRRPSLLLQDILARRPSALFRGKNGKEANGHASKSPFGRSLADTAATSMVTINAHGDGDDRHFAAKQMKVKNRRKGNDALSAALSAFYCKILVLVGVCLPITEVISKQIPNYVYQGFYVYLYMGSILFVAFLYATTLRNRTLFNALKTFHEETQNIHLKHKVTHFGSFYLRVGAIAFAIGTMVYSGLEFGQYFELNGKAGCGDVFIAITPICRMLLAIVQIQFIFLNTTYLDMARHKVICRFGLMHMVATNLCEWLYVLVEETKHEIFHIGHHESDATEALFPTEAHGTTDWSDESLTHTQHITDSMNNTIATTIQNVLTNVTIASAGNTSTQVSVGCSRTNIMGALVQEVAPFLFPCTIEYSLICAVILYEMWKTVRSIPDIDRSRKSSIKPAHQKPANHFSVDCSQSHKGLFFGIIMIVMTIISMIMYFVLYTQPGYELVATQEVTIWEIITYFICTAAIIAGLILIRDLKYVQNSSDDHHSMELDNQLLIVAQTGVYLYGMFSILGSYFSKWDAVPDRIEGIVAEILGLAETSLQTMFILHASHRRCKGAKQARRKPGREIVTFLLIVNIAIWFINTLIKGRAVFRETNLVFFGVWGWTIITHISMPLAIFYRFHSTICLFEVWKITYKAKTH
ncbi:proton channel OtopLc isoform X1 [Bactrocera tryoni]|uniref:proton channel OtopLc isoform X1 n=1 Tax=Bactrocera tryoni TaxID=59916 RepID=UPI001A9981C1|nr:proton channel OtopLc isoform X1 [Bactrocera tryoni]